MWISIIIIIIVSARSARGRGRGRGFLTRYFNTSPSPVRPEQCTMDIPVTFLYPKKAGKKGFLSLPRGFCKNIKIQRREWKSVTSVISLFGLITDFKLPQNIKFKIISHNGPPKNVRSAVSGCQEKVEWGVWLMLTETPSSPPSPSPSSPHPHSSAVSHSVTRHTVLQLSSSHSAPTSRAANEPSRSFHADAIVIMDGFKNLC